MTPNCKNCGNGINETHVTEEIDREGETVTRHYCSARCLAHDKGYARSPTRPITDIPNPQPITDPDPDPNPGPLGRPYWQQLYPYNPSLRIDTPGTYSDSANDVRIPPPHRYEWPHYSLHRLERRGLAHRT
jgi:hypothetical protein